MLPYSFVGLSLFNLTFHYLFCIYWDYFVWMYMIISSEIIYFTFVVIKGRRFFRIPWRSADRKKLWVVNVTGSLGSADSLRASESMWCRG